MIGTSAEMLLFFTYSHETAARLGVTMHRLIRIRERVSHNNYSEDALVEMLSKLECKCIRPRVVIPAIVRDQTGRLFDEHTFVRLFLKQELADKYGMDFVAMKKVNNRGDFIDHALFQHLLHSKRASVAVPRTTLPSVWSYEPVTHMIDDDEIVNIHRMLHYNGETF